MIAIPAWKGVAVPVNRWHSARAMFKPDPQKYNGMKLMGRRTILGRWYAFIFETPKYKQFKKKLTRHFKLCNLPKIEKYIDVKLKTCTHRLKDSDAIIKPIFDALEDAGILKNDNRIRHFFVQRAYHKRGDYDTIVVEIYNTKDYPIEWADNALPYSQIKD